MTKGAKAEISINLGSKKRATTVHDALKPETTHSIGPRSKVGMCLTGKNLIITMQAKDLVALRAAVNSYLRWIASSVDLTQVVDQAKSRHQRRI